MLYSPRRQAPRLLLTTLRVSFVLLLFAATRARAQTITEYPIPTPASLPVEIIAGPDGNLWFAEFAVGVRSIGRITPDSAITEFPLAPNPASGPFSMAAGPDGIVSVAATIRFVLSVPDESVIPEVTVIPMRETSWP